MPNPTISIITSVYNAKDYLPRTVASILVIADLIHGAALQMVHPEYCPAYDMDAEAATESRLRILKYARDNHLTMYGMHLPAPGFIESTMLEQPNNH